MTDAELEQRDEQVAEALENGRSLRAVRKEFSLTKTELDAALTRLWPIDQGARLRLIRRDVGKIDRLIETFFQKALAGDVPSGMLTVKIWERLHALLGMDAAQRIDLAITPSPHQPSRHDRIRAAIFGMARGPDWKPNGGDGAVNMLSDSNDDEPSH